MVSNVIMKHNEMTKHNAPTKTSKTTGSATKWMLVGSLNHGTNFMTTYVNRVPNAVIMPAPANSKTQHAPFKTEMVGIHSESWMISLARSAEMRNECEEPA